MTSRYWTTLVASQGAQSWCCILWITGCTLIRVPDQEKPASTTGSVGADPSRTTPMLHAEMSSEAQVALRVRNNQGGSSRFAPESPAHL
jgi:hypothetical protein